MPVEIPNPLSAERLDAREVELRTALPELYSDPVQRAIVEQVIIPQLRAVLRIPLASVTLPLTFQEIDELCANVDRAVDDHRDLLDTDGLLKPAASKITDLRQGVRAELVEHFKAACRAALAEHGIFDREKLIRMKEVDLRKLAFPPWGGVLAFFSEILGESTGSSARISLRERIADRVGLPQLTEEEQKARYREALAVHGIDDRGTLYSKKIKDYRAMEFQFYGNGHSFFLAILGGEYEVLSLDLLVRVADALDLPLVSEKRQQEYRTILANHDIYDRITLMQMRTADFKKMAFKPYGKGCAFAARILGRTVYDVSRALFSGLADAVGFALEKNPQPAERAKKISKREKEEPTREKSPESYCAALADNGITDRETLVCATFDELSEMIFHPWGHFRAFFSEILGERVRNDNRNLRHRVADRLGFPKLSSEEQQAAYRAALLEHDIHDRFTLHQMGVKDFLRVRFKHYGKGTAFATRVLGKTINRFSHTTFDELADAIGFPPFTPEMFKKIYLDILRINGIADRSALLKHGPIWFEDTEFPPLGKGIRLAHRILDRKVKNITIAILNEIADALGW
ncbi:hypothetical protein HYW83_01955 [Candidatus Peregrinibacteria bacterium]|nr:hypothetical protein [Candidatus Peregrinibacteria bacterium]